MINFSFRLREARSPGGRNSVPCLNPVACDGDLLGSEFVISGDPAPALLLEGLPPADMKAGQHPKDAEPFHLRMEENTSGFKQ